ncbi:MAG TPA: glycosyltransferase family 1 protein [Chloroflexota bacterium]
MRVAIDYTPGINQRAGIGRYTRELFRELIRLDQQDEFVVFYSHPRGQRPEQIFKGAKNVAERPLGISDRWLTILWYRLHVPLPVDLMIGPVDLYHFPNFVLPPVRRGHTIVTVHDLSFLLHPECADEGLRNYLERMVPRAVRRADFVVADSANTQNDLIVLLDADPAQVEVVYPAVDERFCQIEDESALAALRDKYNLHFPFILNQNMIEPRKNIPRLIEAFARLKRDLGIAHRLVIGGGLGWMYESVFQAVEDQEVADSVVFLGYVPDEDLPPLYNLADLFVYPSLYEGFGIPAVEAMACGTPVVTSNTSSLPEAVGDAGLMVRPTDVEAIAEAMAQVLTNPGLRADLSRRGLERARLFTWRASAEKVLSIYRRFAR